MSEGGASAAVAVAEDIRRQYLVRRGVLTPPARLRAVDGVSFTLNAGRTLGVVGESGCGKSTLGRVVALIETPTSGALALDGVSALKPDRTTRARLRRTVQVVFQDPYGSLNPRQKVGSIIAEPLEINTRLGRNEREGAAREMMDRVGLRPEHYARYPHMFSGGQRQRIAIARALILRPKLVVADEPISALDVSIQAQILNLMMDLQEELGLAYLFISHDLAVVRHIAGELLVMYLGTAVEQGRREPIFEQPLHPYTQALLASTPSTDLGRSRRRLPLQGELPSPLSPPAGCPFSTRCPYVTDRCRLERPTLRELAGRRVACHYAERFLAA